MFPATTKKLNDIFNAERVQFCEVLNALAPFQTHSLNGFAVRQRYQATGKKSDWVWGHSLSLQGAWSDIFPNTL